MSLVLMMHDLVKSILSFAAHDLWICIQMPAIQYPFCSRKMSFPIPSWLHKFPIKEFSYYTIMALGPLKRSQFAVLLQKGSWNGREDTLPCRF